MFLTTPESTWPSRRLATSSALASDRLSSSTARRDTTMLPLARGGEFLEGDAALRLQADIDEGDVVLDADDPALQHGAFDVAAPAETLIEQGGETLLAETLGLRSGGFAHPVNIPFSISGQPV